MPTSTEKGFSISKWESKYLKCRYRAHRNKVAAAKPAIDCTAPPDRPHVTFKKKKAMEEERRQVRIIHENLRVLNKTAEIMNDSILPSLPPPPPPPPPPSSAASASGGRNSSCNSSNKDHHHLDPSKERRPITAMMKRNTHILLQWFLHKFGNYFPWWAEISY